MFDLSLPKIADTQKYSNENHDQDKIAVYTLVNLKGGNKKLLQALMQDSNVSDGYIVSKANFSNRPLRDVLEHHLSVAEQEQVEPTIFIAAHSQNFNEDGVLLINANFDLKGGVDKCRVKVSLALLEAVGLQIGNVDWYEIDREESTTNSPQAGSSSEQPSKIIFGAYGTKAGANMTEIRGLLEPGWEDKSVDAWQCESVGSYTGRDPIQQVIKYHPWHCLQKPRMSKQWCICVDNLNPVKEGVLLLHIDWDGNINRQPKALLEIGPQSQSQTERVDVMYALSVLATK